MDLTTLLQASRTLSNDDRLELAMRLWNELTEAGWQPEPDDELAAELDRRLDKHEATPEAVIPAKVDQ